MEKKDPIDELSILKLKHILHVKVQNLDKSKLDEVKKRENSCKERPELVRLVREHVASSEVGTLLKQEDPETGKKKGNEKEEEERAEMKRRVKAKQRNGGGGGGGGGGGAGGIPSPETLRQQASLIRKDPSRVRKATPQFSKMTDAELMQVSLFLMFLMTELDDTRNTYAYLYVNP